MFYLPGEHEDSDDEIQILMVYRASGSQAAFWFKRLPQEVVSSYCAILYCESCPKFYLVGEKDSLKTVCKCGGCLRREEIVR